MRFVVIARDMEGYRLYFSVNFTLRNEIEFELSPPLADIAVRLGFQFDMSWVFYHSHL